MRGLDKKKLVISEHCHDSVDKVVNALIEGKVIKGSYVDLYAAVMTAIDELLETGHIMLRREDKI